MKKRDLLVTLLTLMPLSVAWGVMPARWHHSTEADFAKGQSENTAASSRGEISLNRTVRVLMPTPEAPPVLSAAAVIGDTIYVASGVDNAVYRIDGDKVAKFAAPPTDILTCLRADGEGLLAGGGGEGAGVYRIHPGGAVELIWSEDSVKYVWDVIPGPEGVLYAATGPEAAVYEIAGNNRGRLLFDAGKLARNVLCLATGENGLLYAGTDKDGLVLEIDPKQGNGRVLLDAQEKEIAALVVGPEGELFVATSDAARASSDGAVAPSKTTPGKTDGSSPTPGASSASAPAPAKPTPSSAAPAPSRRAPAATTTTRQAAARPTSASSSRTSTPKASSGKGNAVYRIRKDGIVEEVFRKPVAIFAMVRTSSGLVLGTGNGGGIYSVSLDGDVVRSLADTEAKQVTSLAPWGDRIVFATANKGSAGVLEAGLANEGTYVSPALDAKQVARWGTMRLHVSSGDDQETVAVSTRSGNVAEPDESTWSEWVTQQASEKELLQVASPPARFFQYRLTLRGPGDSSPIVQDVDVMYQVGNLAPIIRSVTASAVTKPGARPTEVTGPKPYRQLAISAADPNADKLLFRVEFRELGASGWIQIAEKLTKPTYAWDTRTVGDGSYELRVVASDSPTNPPPMAMETGRISEPVVVDNTAPEIRLRPATLEGATATLQGEVTDRISRIRTIHYSLDSAEDWTSALPEDGMCDGSQESFRIELPKLSVGEHRVAVRVEDAYGNTGYASSIVTIGE
jgi:hypothetical protein